MLIFNCLNTK